MLGFKLCTIDTCHGLAGMKDECRQPTTKNQNLTKKHRVEI